MAQKSYPTTVIHRSHEWGSISLADDWGPDTPDEAVAQLTKLVVDRFEELVKAAGAYAMWFPSMGEVHAHCRGETTAEHHWSDLVYPLPNGVTYKELRNQATYEVWDAVIGEPSPMKDQVDAILQTIGQ